jgi:hypothetical protein
MVVPTRGNLEQTLLGLLRALADSLGNFIGLAQTGPDVTVLIADHDQCRE